MQLAHLVVLLEFRFQRFAISDGEELLDDSAVLQLPIHQQVVHESGDKRFLCGNIAWICLLDPACFLDERELEAGVELLQVGS